MAFNSQQLGNRIHSPNHQIRMKYQQRYNFYSPDLRVNNFYQPNHPSNSTQENHRNIEQIVKPLSSKFSSPQNIISHQNYSKFKQMPIKKQHLKVNNINPNPSHSDANSNKFNQRQIPHVNLKSHQPQLNETRQLVVNRDSHLPEKSQMGNHEHFKLLGTPNGMMEKQKKSTQNRQLGREQSNKNLALNIYDVSSQSSNFKLKKRNHRSQQYTSNQLMNLLKLDSPISNPTTLTNDLQPQQITLTTKPMSTEINYSYSQKSSSNLTGGFDINQKPLELQSKDQQKPNNFKFIPQDHYTLESRSYQDITQLQKRNELEQNLYLPSIESDFMKVKEKQGHAFAEQHVGKIEIMPIEKLPRHDYEKQSRAETDFVNKKLQQLKKLKSLDHQDSFDEPQQKISTYVEQSLKHTEQKEEIYHSIQNQEPILIIQNPVYDQTPNQQNNESKGINTQETSSKNQYSQIEILQAKVRLLNDRQLETEKVKIQLQSKIHKLQLMITNLTQQLTAYQQKTDAFLNREKMLLQNIEQFKKKEAILEMKNDEYVTIINKLKSEIKAKQDSQKPQEKPMNFDGALKIQLQEITNLKMKIEQSNEEIQRLHHHIADNKRKAEEAINEAAVQKLKYLSELKQISQKSEIIILNKQNEAKSVKHAMETLEGKLVVAINENKAKDSFIKQYLVGRSKTQEEKSLVDDIIGAYRVEFNFDRIGQKIMEQQQQIQELKQQLAIL